MASHDRPRALATFALLLTLALSGCSGQTSVADGEIADVAAQDATATAEVAGGCLVAPETLLVQIAVGTEEGTTFEPTEGAAVRAREGVYVVAVRFRGSGSVEDVGVWTATALEGTAAPMLVADELSSAYTTWNSVEEMPQYGVEPNSPLIAAARDCLGR